MTTEPPLKFHHRISFKILLGITLLILAVEAVLFAFSVSSRRQELQMYREDTYQTLSRQSEPPGDREEIMSGEEIRIRLASYSYRILLMVIFILVVVAGGSYMIINQILIRPILQIYTDNLAIANRVEATTSIAESDYPQSEIGLIMRSRKDMLDSLDQSQNEILSAKRQLEKQNEVLRENAKLREDIERITRHDLKSPLNGIVNFPDIISAKGGLSEKQRTYLKKIKELGYQILNMINLSTELYKMEQGAYAFQPIPLDILPVLDNIFQENTTLMRTKKLEADLRLNGRTISDNDHFVVPGEPLLFYSMLANLIKNAMEASPRKEKINVSLDDREQFTITVNNQGAVPKDIRDRFFEKYVTSGKKAGTGLGTYSARLIAETQGGHISLDVSRADETTLRVIFPQMADIQRSDTSI